MTNVPQVATKSRPIRVLVKRCVAKLRTYGFVRKWGGRIEVERPQPSDGGCVSVYLTDKNGELAASVRIGHDPYRKPRDARDVALWSDESFVTWLHREDGEGILAAMTERLESVTRRERVTLPVSPLVAARLRVADMHSACDEGEYTLTRTPIKTIRNDSGRLIGFCDPHDPCTGRRILATKGGKDGKGVLPAKHMATTGRRVGSAPGGEPRAGFARPNTDRPDLDEETLTEVYGVDPTPSVVVS